MKNTTIITLAYIIFLPYTASGGHTHTNSSINTAWGGRADWAVCMPPDTQGCIGQAYVNNNCDAFRAKQNINQSSYSLKEYPLLMMVAHKINENGAYFCPIQAELHNRTNTVFSSPLKNQTCIWLCREGWTGHECQTSADSFTGACDITPFLRENYNNTAVNKQNYNNNLYQNIEWQIPYFNSSYSVNCNSAHSLWDAIVGKREHDILLAINKWLDSGNGAFVRQMIFRVAQKSKTEYGIVVYPASGSMDILVCKNGYKPNLANNDCEPINPDKCNAAKISTEMCPNWNATLFDEQQHTWQYNGNCYTFKCTNPNMALMSSQNPTCTQCEQNLRTGIHPENGTCVQCEMGQMFNESAESSDYCVQATALSRTDLMYGHKNTKNTAPAKISDQCWTKIDPTEYRECILGNQ